MDGSVHRVLDDRGWEEWVALSSSEFYDDIVADGRLIGTTVVSVEERTLAHTRVPLITYPYEWTFSMLRQAAMLQLDLLDDALQNGLTLKDATPYNVQFVGSRPTFIDVGSFERYREGEPWIGYTQFCRQFLYPLLMRAWVGIPFQPWLRGSIEGPSAADMARMLPARRKVQPAGLLHVMMQARAEKQFSGEKMRDSLRESGFNAEMIRNNVAKLRTLIEGLEAGSESAGWVTYEGCDHVGRDRGAKTEFLRKALAEQGEDLDTAVDFGANDGHFSLVAAEYANSVVAVDGDEPVLDSLWQRLRMQGDETINVVLSDLTDPSPSRGWADAERASLIGRLDVDLVIAYGVIHHLIYTASVPPVKVLDWLASFQCAVVVEYVAPEDPMVIQLTANKEENELHVDRDRTGFQSRVEERFSIDRKTELEGGTRILYQLSPLP
ncbi:MAG: methyltransferase [Acidimicrobiia bacterium]|nr:methyltransferase [Acidimicrobiia bacterium]